MKEGILKDKKLYAQNQLSELGFKTKYDGGELYRQNKMNILTETKRKGI